RRAGGHSGAKPPEDRGRAPQTGRPVATIRNSAQLFALAKRAQNTMAKSGVRDKITLACNDCKRRNYMTTKSKRNTPDRLEVRKSARGRTRHTVHGEPR